LYGQTTGHLERTMFKKTDLENLAMQKGKEIKLELQKMGKSQEAFADEFFMAEIAPQGLSQDDLDMQMRSHRGRFVRGLARKNCEINALYLSYLKRRYITPDGISLADRDAAYEFYTVFQSKIATVELKDGLVQDALSSLHSIFTQWRSISEKYGKESAFFFEHSKEHMNTSFREFTAKWHPLIQDGTQEALFRKELVNFQQLNKAYCERLKKDFYLNYS